MKTKQIVTPLLPFEDAEEMQKQNLETFFRPSEQELQSLKAGMLAKLCTGGERFWVIVIEVEGDKIRGVVDNELVRTETHGLKLNDLIEFEFRHIYDIDSVEK
jgi:hypothetical protein